MEINQIYNQDALEGLKQLDESSIDAIISDPPYQLDGLKDRWSKATSDNSSPPVYYRQHKGFMGKEWDILPSVDILKECLRVLKSGAWAMWLMTPRQDSQLEFLLRLRQAGFNISFSSMEWIYASGFPKAADLSLLADKRACKEDLMQKLDREPTKEEFKEAWGKWREVTGHDKKRSPEHNDYGIYNIEWDKRDNPNSPEAQALSGSYAGMQLKPARELIIVSQKPISGKTYLDQALLHLKEPEHNQLGGTWLDDCRIPYNKLKETDKRVGTNISIQTTTPIATSEFKFGNGINGFKAPYYKDEGRFPANIIVSDNALDIGMKHSIGHIPMQTKGISGKHIYGKYSPIQRAEDSYLNDSGDLSRYFDLDFWFENKLKELPEEQQKIFPFLYVPKASKSERNKGLEHLEEKEMPYGSGSDAFPSGSNTNPIHTKQKNIHPTAKPIKLMGYLITLTTRENDVVLDPFTGSGTTAISSILLKRRFIGFEREEEYYKIATERIKYYQNKDAIQFQHSLLGSE